MDAGVPRQLQARQVIVTLVPVPPSPEWWPSLTDAVAHAHGLSRVGAFPLTSLGVQCAVFRVPEGRSLDDVLARLAADPRVEAVQPNQAFQGLASSRGDPYAALQYGAQAIGADRAHRWATGKGVKVALVDTGVELTHPDLRGQIARTANFVDGGERTFAEDSHGTAVAGVIAARAGNDIGIFGIAPGAQLLALKACWHRAAGARDALCSSWTLAKAVDFAILAGARVLNLSLGGPPDPLLTRLIMRALDHGISVVAAVVEDTGQAPGFPASLEPVIAVAASDPGGQVGRAAGLKRGAVLAAPGIDILTTAPRHAYDFLSGSSLAAAHVSGAAALLLEVEPRLSPAQVRSLLFGTARPIKTEAPAFERAVGLLDACAALAKVLGAQPCP